MLAILQNGSQSVPNYLNVCVNEPCEYQQTSSLDSLLELVIEAFFLSFFQVLNINLILKTRLAR